MRADRILSWCFLRGSGFSSLTASEVLWFFPLLQVRGELLQERVQRLEAQEAHFAESLVALQFQKVARAAETLSVYTTLLSIQELLLGELSESETLTKSACAQILESHSPVSGVAGWGGGLPQRLLVLPGPLSGMELVSTTCPVCEVGTE